ncbi:MAG: UDP-N-acetylmuramoyl-tripeptide--D-alanyl-D-alanine ligase [Elainellaceae cyanobacterium]
MALHTSLGQIVEILQSLQNEALSLPRSAHTIAISGIETDSRTVGPGEVFLALKGDVFDGHKFVTQAFDRGAIAAIVDRQSDIAHEAHRFEQPILAVTDTLEAYQAIARWWRHQCPAKIIAVTGSVGKTTTKELIAAVLAQHGSVLKTQANYNNEIGVPKTLLQLESSHHFAVIEMGMRAAGEIATLTQIAQPDIAVITNVGTAHIGRLGSEEAIAQAKCELLADLPSGGVAVLNGDDERLMRVAQSVWAGSCITFGLSNGTMTGTFIFPDALAVQDQTFSLPLPGRHNALNFMAALAVAKALHLDWRKASQNLLVQLPTGRAQQHWLANDILALDETYNAGVESMTAALHLLAQTPGARRIAVLGTMKELGDRSVELHHRVGKMVQTLNLDYLFVLADPSESQAMAEGAASVPVECFTHAESLVERLATVVTSGDRLLFKASRAVGLEHVIQQLAIALSTQNTDSPTS